MGKIFCFIGKSSTGKDTIFNIIKNDYPELIEIIPYTTRPIRTGEIDGITYHFIDKEQLEEMRKKNQIIEERSYDTIKGIWTYLTASTNIDLAHNNYIIINTLEGYQKIRKHFGNDNVIPIYISIKDNGNLLQRAINREKSLKNPNYLELCRRYLADQHDFSIDKLIEANINKTFYNEDLLECCNEIKEEINYYIQTEKQVKTKKLKVANY